MNKRILVIVDNLNCNWIANALSKGDKNALFDVLALGFNGVLQVSENPKAYQQLNSYKIIDVIAFAEQAQENVRKFIPQFIYDFPRRILWQGKSLLDILRYRKCNLWWFNKMSEKAGLGTPFIKRIYYLELVRQVLKRSIYQEVWIELEDDAMAVLLNNNQQLIGPQIVTIRGSRQNIAWRKNLYLKLLYNVFFFQLFIFLRWVFLGFIGLRDRLALKKETVLLFTFYPFFWSKPFTSDAIEAFYQSLPNKLSQQHQVGYAAWLTMGIRSLWKRRKQIAKTVAKNNIIILENCLGLKGFFAAFLISLAYIVKLGFYRLLMRPKIAEKYQGFDITNLVLDELEQSMVSTDTMMCVFITKALDALTKKKAVSALIYRVEFQPHERAVLYGLGRRCLSLAFQHNAIAQNHLQYYFPQEEIRLSYAQKNNPDNLPLPDKVMLAGQSQYELFKSCGFPEETLYICGPVRYSNLIRYLKNSSNKYEMRDQYGYSEKQLIYLVALPVQREDVINFIDSLIKATKGINNKELLFLFKAHPDPFFNFEKLAATMIDRNYPEMKHEFLRNDIMLNDYLLLADALLLTGTTMGIEAISLGTLPILLENKAAFNLNPLLGIKNAYLEVNSAPELKAALLAQIINDEKVAAIRQTWPDAIKRLFYSLAEDPNERFCAGLDEMMAKERK